jgi:hypothetical protein
VTKIALIGAGSTQFARRLIADLFSWPSLRDCHLALVDVNPEPLALMHALALATARKAGAGPPSPPTPTASPPWTAQTTSSPPSPSAASAGATGRR